ncbi:DUF3182 family protein [Xanthomonas maliensis]|uniref:DUF3182 family protein n=1 Tax=Xanthomonas maliensis TaxID=1321368 RepID=UPI0003B41489|nr:DUF3182 family protein [Xanthomonas maliensis]KAB7769146.1 DUF3182 domain-containing protein [Xanthomonas maliensis]
MKSMPFTRVVGHCTRQVADHGHERKTHAWVCAEVARLLKIETTLPAGDGLIVPGTYHIPDETLTATQARALGIADVGEVLGGIVPHAFLATKVIGHPLVGDDATCVDGWSQPLAKALQVATLPGYTVFAAADAEQALTRLQPAGPVRLKLPTGVGGGGQWKIEDTAQLRQLLTQLPSDYLALHGAVLEHNVLDPVTHSVGEVMLAGVQIAYVGTQCSVQDAEGAEVYGGSSLRIQRGSLEALAVSALPPLQRKVVEQACIYDRFIAAAYPALQISRRNYDVISGRDLRNAEVGGVLEQSWRVGGATPAELAAIECFLADPTSQWVTASTHELYRGEPPDDAQIYYRAEPGAAGPRYKYRKVSVD